MNADTQLAVALGGVIVDTETTGLARPGQEKGKPWGDQVVEVAAVDGPTGEVLFHSYVRPKVPFHPGARKVLKDHGFDFGALKSAPGWDAVFPALVDAVCPPLQGREYDAYACYLAENPGAPRDPWTGRCPRPLVAWNSGFDDRLIRQTCGVFGMKPDSPGVDRRPTLVRWAFKDPPEWRQLRRHYADKNTRLALSAAAEQAKRRREEAGFDDDELDLAMTEAEAAEAASFARKVTHSVVTYHTPPPRRLRRSTYQVTTGACRETYGLGLWVDAMRLYCEVKEISGRGRGYYRQAKALAEAGDRTEAPDENSLFRAEEAIEFAEAVGRGRAAHGAVSDCQNLRGLLRGLLAEARY